MRNLFKDAVKRVDPKTKKKVEREFAIYNKGYDLGKEDTKKKIHDFIMKHSWDRNWGPYNYREIHSNVLAEMFNEL